MDETTSTPGEFAELGQNLVDGRGMSRSNRSRASPHHRP